jgi:uncharacterized protein YggE
MDFKVKVSTFTGEIRELEIKDMPDESAARAEAVGLTFGKILSIERIDKEPPPEPKKRPLGAKSIMDAFDGKPIKPGETQRVVTGYNNDPLMIFRQVDIW